MSNIFLKKRKGNIPKYIINEFNLVKSYDHFNSSGNTKHFSPSNKEWSNSIYAYDKNSLKSLPTYNLIVTNLIKSYFNLYDPNNNLKKTRKMSRRMRIRLKRFSFNKVFTSKAELKHTNSSVVVTSNIYNAQERHSRYNLQKISYINEYSNLKNKRKLIGISKKKKLNLVKKLKLTKHLTNINRKAIFKNKKESLNLNKQVFNKINRNNIKSLNINDAHKVYLIRITRFLQKTIATIIKKIKKQKDLKDIFLNKKLLFRYILSKPKVRKFVKKLFKTEMSTLYFKDLIYFNRSKFYNTYLLNNLISKIYDKKVEFNFVNLKYLFLNSDIFTESIYTKLKNRKNKPVKVLNKSLRSIKLPVHNKFYETKASESKKYYKTLWFNSFDSSLFLSELSNSSFNKDILNEFLQEMYYFKKNNQVKETLNLIRYKAVNGLRIEASGRLTRRLTAARSVSKVRHKGGLKNIESSYNGMSSAMIRNHVRPNIQYSKESSKTRNGSFGIKVWISGK